MFDVKQLDNAYDPAEQIQIALGVHPDQVDARQSVGDLINASQGNSSGLAQPAGVPASATNVHTDRRSGQTSYSEDGGSTWKPAQNVAQPDAPTIAPIARPGDTARAINMSAPVSPMAVSTPAPGVDAATPAGINPMATTGTTPASLAAPTVTPAVTIAPIASPTPSGPAAPNMDSTETPDQSVKLIPPSAASDTQAVNMSTAEPTADQTRLANDEAELDRKKRTGSGISQIKNPFLRGLARVGEVAGSVLFPTIAAEVPGTEFHHQVLMNQDRANIGEDLGIQEKNAEIRQKGALADQEQAKANQLNNPKSKPMTVKFDNGIPFGVIGKDGTEYTIGDPENPPDVVKFGNAALTAHQQRIKEQQDAQNNRPDTATQNKQQFQDIGSALAKEMDGNMPKDFYTNPATQAKIVNDSKTLTPEQKQFFVGYSLANPTPASQALNVVLRGETYAAGRPVKVFDTQDHTTKTVSLAENERGNAETPGRYLSPDYAPEAIMQRTVAKDLAGGKMKDQIVSFNTLLYHIGDASEGIDEIRNTKSPLINKPMNWLKANALGDPNVSNLVQRMEPVKKEFESFLLNNRALYAEDRAAVDKILNENQSPAQMQEAMKQFAHTAALRLGTQNDAYRRSSRGKDIPDLVNPQVQMLLDKYGEKIPGYSGNSNSDNSAQNNNSGGSSMTGPITPDEMKRNLTATGSNGHTVVFRGGKWVDPNTGAESK